MDVRQGAYLVALDERGDMTKNVNFRFYLVNPICVFLIKKTNKLYLGSLFALKTVNPNAQKTKELNPGIFSVSIRI